MIKLKGRYRFEGFNKAGKKVFDKTYSNVITQSLFTNFFKNLNAESAVLNLTHMATGSGVNTALKADTALQTEVFRKAITTKTYGATQFICKLSLGAPESVFTIREIGLFADATSTPGSGILFSRCNVNIVKNASTQYLITFTITAQ
jgi:hypothetical protein